MAKSRKAWVKQKPTTYIEGAGMRRLWREKEQLNGVRPITYADGAGMTPRKPKAKRVANRHKWRKSGSERVESASSSHPAAGRLPAKLRP